MKRYSVWDWDFKYFGFVVAEDESQAMREAKKLYRTCVAPMVQAESN